MKKLTKVQIDKLVKDVVGKILNDGADYNDLAPELMSSGVPASIVLHFDSHIKTVGLAQGWILTEQQVKAKVEEAVKDTELKHFLDVQTLAHKMKVPQMSTQELQEAIIKYSGVKASGVKASSKFTQFSNSGYMGNIARWCEDHPNFTAQELHNSKSCYKSSEPSKLSPIAPLYYDEVLAYRAFFKSLKTEQAATEA